MGPGKKGKTVVGQSGESSIKGMGADQSGKLVSLNNSALN